jgi:hypothetical protein
MPSKPRKPIANMIEELKSWLLNYDHGPNDYPTLLWRVLASIPGGDEAEDMGYEPFQLGWQEVDQLGRVLVAIQDKRDVEDLIAGLLADGEEGEVDEARRQRAPAASRSYPYDKSPSGQYVLTRDGREVLLGTEQEIWSWMHKNVSSSVDHALKHEGYRIAPADGARSVRSVRASNPFSRPVREPARGRGRSGLAARRPPRRR